MALRSLFDVAAPAKLNLFLHVIGRRPDGYHLLQSLFVLIDWCDTLHFELRTDGRLARHDLGDPTTCACAPPGCCRLKAARPGAPTSPLPNSCLPAPAWAAAALTRHRHCSR